MVKKKRRSRGSKNSSDLRDGLSMNFENEVEGDDEVRTCALVSGDSGLRHLVEEQYSLVPETQIRSGRDVMMEELEVSRLHGIQKEVGYYFTMEDGTVVQKLVVMEKIDEDKKVARENENGNL